jgi:hypothetical protein
MAKIKKFEFMVVPVQIEYLKPISGRVFATFALLKCIKLFKFNVYGYKFYRLSIPRFERCVK